MDDEHQGSEGNSQYASQRHNLQTVNIAQQHGALTTQLPLNMQNTPDLHCLPHQTSMIQLIWNAPEHPLWHQQGLHY